MAITAWLSSPVALTIPGAASAYLSLPNFVSLNGEEIFGIPYFVNYQGQVAQPFQAYGLVFDLFGDLLGGGPGTTINASNPSVVTGSYAGTVFGVFGGAYSNAFIDPWIATLSSTGSPASVNYVIFSQDVLGALTATNVANLFSNLTIAGKPAGNPSPDFRNLQSASILDGNVLLAVDTFNASNLEQLDFALINGSGVGAPLTFSYSDPSWVANTAYSWDLGRLNGATVYGLLDAAGSTLRYSTVLESGTVASVWTLSTAFTAISSAVFNTNTAGNALLVAVNGVTAAGYAHELLFVRADTGAFEPGGTLASPIESFSGTPTQNAKVAGIGGVVSGWIEYWVDAGGLHLEEITYTNSQLTVAGSYTFAGANGSASVIGLGDGRAQVTWQVLTGALSAAGTTSVDYTDIVDFRTAGLNGPGVSIGHAIAGTAFNDTFTHIAGSYTIDGGGGNDLYVAPYSSFQVTVSIDASGQAVLAMPDGTDTLIGVGTVQLNDGFATISGNTVTLSVTGGDTTVSTFNIPSQSYTKTVTTLDNSGNMTSLEYEGYTGTSYDAVEYFFTGSAAHGYTNVGFSDFYSNQASGLTEIDFDAAGNIVAEAYAGPGGSSYSNLSYSLSGTSAGGYAVIGIKLGYTGQASGLTQVQYDGGGNLIQVVFGYPSSGAGSLTGLTLDYVAGLHVDSLFTYQGPGGAQYAQAIYEYDSAGQYAGVTFDYQFTGQTYNFVQVSYTSGASPTLTEVTDSGYTGSGGAASPSEISYFFSGGAFAGSQEVFTGVTGQAYTSVIEDYSAAGVNTSSEYSGFTGTAYDGLVYFNDSAGALQYIGFEYKGVTGTVHGQAYYSYITIANASDVLLATDYRLDNGGNVYIGEASGLTSPLFGGVGSGALPNSAPTAYALTGGDWTITGGGSNETFNFAAAFNTAEITDYGAAFNASAPDIVSVSTVDFANWATLLGSASASGAGGANTTFTSATTGDRLTLDGVTVAQLSALTPAQANADFLFHA